MGRRYDTLDNTWVILGKLPGDSLKRGVGDLAQHEDGIGMSFCHGEEEGPVEGQLQGNAPLHPPLLGLRALL